MFKGDSMYSILPIDATYFFNITKYVFRKKSTSKAYLTRPRALPYRMQAD